MLNLYLFRDGGKNKEKKFLEENFWIYQCITNHKITELKGPTI